MVMCFLHHNPRTTKALGPCTDLVISKGQPWLRAISGLRVNLPEQ